uniref:Uncharacterized protein n=1 Tax=Arundo donax TaxID=35708 RepID=A0A0A9A436_ARUDO
MCLKNGWSCSSFLQNFAS